MPWVTWMTSSRRAYIISGYWNSARVRAAVLEFADERAKQNAQSDGTRVPCKRVVRRMSTRVKPHLAVTTTKSACFRLRRNLMKKAAKVGRTTLPREHSLVLAAFLFSSLSLSLCFFYAGRKKGTAAMHTVSSWFAYESLHYSLLSFRRDYISNSGPVAGHPRKKGKYHSSYIGRSYDTLI